MNIPNHVAIICDGNRRWAKAHNLPAMMGHKKGHDAVVQIAKHLRKRGVHTLTAWGFSTENWNRTEEEVSNLMHLFENVLDSFLDEAIREKIQLHHLGRKDRLPKQLVQKIAEAEEATAQFTDHVFNVAIDYGGRDEIVRAINSLITANPNTPISEEDFADYLDTKGQTHPNPDLVIRTGGEKRISGYLLWQLAYAEFFFLDEPLPDITTEHIDSVLEEFASRQRRFGK
ncbi:MAG: Isoprenyl transferase [Microgenomates bacterium OLB22]|nr:MAG: Isoprenyl transferase [Microgenomates bacterium OLB22]